MVCADVLRQVDDYESALHDMHSGETIKPVLVW